MKKYRYAGKDYKDRIYHTTERHKEFDVILLDSTNSDQFTPKKYYIKDIKVKEFFHAGIVYQLKCSAYPYVKDAILINSQGDEVTIGYEIVTESYSELEIEVLKNLDIKFDNKVKIYSSEYDYRIYEINNIRNLEYSKEVSLYYPEESSRGSHISISEVNDD